MTLTTLAAGLSWYDKLVEKIPEGQLFSWRAVFDAIPSLIETFTNNAWLNNSRCDIWLVVSFTICYRENQSHKGFVSDSSCFC